MTPDRPSGGGRVLVVEDEPKIASFLSRALTACGFEASHADRVPVALEMTQRISFDLVLLDLLLPEVNGFAFLEGTLHSTPRPAVLVVSALSDVESKVKCFELGAADYVTKPFVLAELVARVRARLRVSKDLVSTRYLLAGAVRLDLQRRTVDVGSGPVALSTREFHLLEHLLRNQGQVCTRTELLSSVWGYEFDPGTNVVDVYVRRLRGKLGNSLIETVRNVGYSITVAA